jgi:hypothetical protein
MDSGGEAFPNDIAALKAELAAARDRHIIEAARIRRSGTRGGESQGL